MLNFPSLYIFELVILFDIFYLMIFGTPKFCRGNVRLFIRLTNHLSVGPFKCVQKKRPDHWSAFDGMF